MSGDIATSSFGPVPPSDSSSGPVLVSACSSPPALSVVATAVVSLDSPAVPPIDGSHVVMGSAVALQPPCRIAMKNARRMGHPGGALAPPPLQKRKTVTGRLRNLGEPSPQPGAGQRDVLLHLGRRLAQRVGGLLDRAAERVAHRDHDRELGVAGLELLE